MLESESSHRWREKERERGVVEQVRCVITPLHFECKLFHVSIHRRRPCTCTWTGHLRASFRASLLAGSALACSPTRPPQPGVFFLTHPPAKAVGFLNRISALHQSPSHVPHEARVSRGFVAHARQHFDRAAKQISCETFETSFQIRCK